jgi:spore coat protein A
MGMALATSSAFFLQPCLAASATAQLNPKQVPKFVNILVNPLDPAFVWKPDAGTTSQYTLSIYETQQGLGLGAATPTTIWGYGTSTQAPTFPGRTFEVSQGTPITVTYVNKLTDAAGNPLPNRMPVDTTLDWANPGTVGGVTPVPVVAHLHGGDSAYLGDGLPDAWGTPCAGSTAAAGCTPGALQQAGRLFSVPYQYENSQESGTLWYHDHALGITRTNVYMGLAGFYFIRDSNEDVLRNASVLPQHPYEIPLVIQDREFTSTNQLYYPVGRTPVNSHLPEFFGRVILVNGQAWPKLDVEPRKYRLRMLNGSDSRFYDMKFESFAPNASIVPGKGAPVPVMVIGTELGLLDTPAIPNLNGVAGILPIGPGERYDVIVDFSAVPAGNRVVITNTANSPYPGGAKPDANLTDRLMAFDVKLPLGPALPATVALGTNLRPVSGALPPVNTAGIPVRRIFLYEGTDALGRLQTMIGPVDADPATNQVGTLTFKDPITEKPKVGTTEIWEFYNTTVDAHPIHMHLVDFRVLDRQAFTAALSPKLNTDGSAGAILDPLSIAKQGTPVAANAWEGGRKDTTKAFPGEVTRVLVSFKRTGEYVFHCHILSHEDHEMMRPYEVVP